VSDRDPSIWDLVVGHDEAVAMLKEAVAADRVTHAWLFTGPPGIGKLHTARVFAAALNCPAGGDGSCDTCRRILRGVHPDVHLIVPEGDNLLVEDVRAVREEASRTHHEARTAVFVLDEADRLTEAAANALLKVLEEPPPEVVFVLVARSAEALVGTVPSRARTVAFASLSLAELTAALHDDLHLDPDQTTWAAAASHGRLARARALLTDEAARTRRSTVLDLTGRLASGQPSDALAAAATVVAIADEVAAAARVRQERELAELEEAYGTGRGTGALRKRLETRHRRELRRVRFDAIRDSLADLLGAYRDVALLAAGASGPGAGDGLDAGGSGASERDGPESPENEGRSPGAAPLVHPDKAGSFARLAAAIDPASALRAAGALEEADRRLAIGAAPLLTLEAAFLSAQAALRGPAVPINRLAIRR
jgi:DNA polymerase III subunit delta'